MSTAALPPRTAANLPLTYDEYLSSPVEKCRYDILDGEKIYRRYGVADMTSPSRLHQQVQGNLYLLLREYATRTRWGQALLAPCDLLITKIPLRVRQPDLLLISRERLDRNPPANDPAPLSPAPELVIEIASPSDRSGVLAAKLADYRTADVREVWVVNLESRTVELFALSDEAIESVAVRRVGETLAAATVPDLAISVEAIFAE